MNINESLVVSDPDFTWSYSRLKLYDTCKYAWYLKYIYDEEEENSFFSDFGTYMHHMYNLLLTGQLKFSEAAHYYMLNFMNYVKSAALSQEIFISYFRSGLKALDDISKLINECSVVGCEIFIDFWIQENHFVGYIDCLLKDKNGNLIIVDHKSRKLKRSLSKTKKTKADELVDEYMKQLYIYSEAVKQKYGSYPTELWLNCFQNDNPIIKEKFSIERCSAVKDWTVSSIDKIRELNGWEPSPNWYFCKNICGYRNKCEYCNYL